MKGRQILYHRSIQWKMIQCMVAKNSLLNVTSAIHSLHQRLHERFRYSVPYSQPYRCLGMDRRINLCTSMRNLMSPCEVPLSSCSRDPYVVGVLTYLICQIGSHFPVSPQPGLSMIARLHPRHTQTVGAQDPGKASCSEVPPFDGT
jgi:hypothetical protein